MNDGSDWWIEALLIIVLVMWGLLTVYNPCGY